MSDKEKEMETVTAAAENEEESMVIVFKKPYVFEHEEYTEIDLSCLEDIQASDMIAVNKIMKRTSPGIDACNIAARATKKPVEFFLQLRPKDAIKVKNRVLGFFFGSE